MLVAMRDMNCFGKAVRLGEPIPTPERWDPVALTSNINLGWVKDVTKEEQQRLSGQSAPPIPIRTETVVEQTNELRCCGRDFKSKRALSLHARSHR